MIISHKKQVAVWYSIKSKFDESNAQLALLETQSHILKENKFDKFFTLAHKILDLTFDKFYGLLFS